MNPATQHHLDFAPPRTRGLVRSVALALMAHLGLVAILAVGVAWKREAPSVAVEAELWAAVPVEAAPLPSEPPEPLPAPEPQPVPEPPLPTPPPPEPVVAPTPPKTVDIALAIEKERLRKEKEQQEAQLAQKEAQRKAQLEQQRKDKLAQEKLRLDQERQDKLAKAQQAERDKAQKAADQAKKDAAAKLAKADAKRTAELRAQQLKRMTELAGAPTGSGGSGTAAKSAGPSGGYNARVAGRIKPNVTYTDIIVGNPKTEVEVTLSAGGDILSRRVVKSSGNASWDTAAVNAIDKTAKLPLDDGKVWSPMIIEMSPQSLLGQ
jgi:colicin import membrane protein